jgi:hypothetical protein
MKKIPVGATLARAGRFTIHSFLRILGIMAVPMAIMFLPSLLLRHRMMALSMQMAAHDFSAMRDMLAILLPVYIVIFVLLSMQMIGIARLALGMQRSWFYFSLGKPIWRLIGSMLLLMVAAILGWIAVFLGIALLGMLSAMLIKLVANTIFALLMGAIVLVLSVALFCGWFYSFVRLSFLLLPVIAAMEDGFALARSWTLGLGNFWRMFAILLVIFIPLAVLELWLIFGYLMRGVPFPPVHATAEQTAAFSTAMNVRMLTLTDSMYQYWYISYPVMIVFAVLFYGFITGTQVFAYRALTSDEVPGG